MMKSHREAEAQHHATRRVYRTVVGFLLAGAGVFLLVKVGADVQTAALLLIGVGCGIIEPSLVTRIFKQ